MAAGLKLETTEVAAWRIHAAQPLDREARALAVVVEAGHRLALRALMEMDALAAGGAVAEAIAESADHRRSFGLGSHPVSTPIAIISKTIFLSLS
jgi:hypothetical protein